MGDWLVTELAPKFGALGIARSDIMLLNFAVWVNVADEYSGNLAMWADYYERHRAQLPFVIWRDASVQHFDTPTGALQQRQFRHCLSAHAASLWTANFCESRLHDAKGTSWSNAASI